MIVAPGGGHQQLVWASEGTDIAVWLNSIGVAACPGLTDALDVTYTLGMALPSWNTCPVMDTISGGLG